MDSKQRTQALQGLLLQILYFRACCYQTPFNCPESRQGHKYHVQSRPPVLGRASCLHEGLSSLASAVAVAAGVTAAPKTAAAARPPSSLISAPPPSPRPYLWQILMTDPPQMQPYSKAGEAAVLRTLARTCNTLLLGEHSGSNQDHELQLRIIELLRRYKPAEANLVLAIEMVQQRFQPALDDFVRKVDPNSSRAERTLREATEWDRRWAYPLELYLPILRIAREHNLKLLAMGVDSEIISKVREVGLEGLSQEERDANLLDPPGFIQSAKDASFKLYAERFIIPSFVARSEAAMQGSGAPSPATFIAARILWDESMATRILRHLQHQPRDLVVSLLDAEHIKFGMGTPARLSRLAQTSGIRFLPRRGDIKSILLNPTPDDTGSQSKRLRLSLGYAANLDKCRPLADYLWYSEWPKVAWLEHPQNPLDHPYRDEDLPFQIFSAKR